MDNQVLTWLVGVIAVCMVFSTVIVVIIGLNVMKTMKRVNKLLLSSQNNFTHLSDRAIETINDIKMETKLLAYQASGNISKLAVGTFFAGSLYRFLKKKLNSESVK